MHRRDLQDLSKLRLKEARVLLSAQHWSGAYYLAGYAAECAIKACIAKKTMRGDFPNKGFANQVHTHDVVALVKAAGLQSQLDQRIKDPGTFAVYWTIVKDWDVSSRYTTASESEARDLLSALTARKEGVIPWIKQHW